MLDSAICHAACDAKDRRFDGRFYVGIKSTGIYCRCVCPARQVKRANRTFWPSAAAAEVAGFRPCLRCRPERAPGLAPIDATAQLAAAAYTRIEAGALEDSGLEALAADLGVTARHLRRVMQAEFGASPIAIAQTGRLLAARRLLNETALGLADVAFAAGFKSVRRFNAMLKERYGAAPRALRGRSTSEHDETFTVALAARGDCNLAPTLEFLRARSLGAIERCEPMVYARSMSFAGAVGAIAVHVGPLGVELTLCETLARQLRGLVANVRGAFDLDADMAAVDAHLARDVRLAAHVRREPGVRIPGAIDGFECAIRAVLGQQITVAGARTLAERLVAKFGAPLASTPRGFARTFPTASALADASVGSIAAVGMPAKRATTIRAVARACADGTLVLARGATAAARAGFAAIPGIGPWTVEYVALRALGDPDAYPATDAALCKALGRKGETLEHLRPWRAYAAVRLWRSAARGGTTT